MVIMPFDDEDQAVAIANGTDFGLVAGVFGENLNQTLRVANRLIATKSLLTNGLLVVLKHHLVVWAYLVLVAKKGRKPSTVMFKLAISVSV